MDKVTIIAGKYKGQKIATPGKGTHPMGSREKLALFNMIAGRIEGSLVLDAFAGSGALGLEALSRGANSVVFVEKNPKAAKVISENLKSLGVESDFEVIKGAVSGASGDFDIVLADPPYDDFDIKEVGSLASLVKSGGILVLSHPFEAPVFEGLTLLKTHKYARAHISVYAKD